MATNDDTVICDRAVDCSIGGCRHHGTHKWNSDCYLAVLAPAACVRVDLDGCMTGKCVPTIPVEDYQPMQEVPVIKYESRAPGAWYSYMTPDGEYFESSFDLTRAGSIIGVYELAMLYAEELDGMRKENARLQEQLDDARDIFNEMSEDY